MNPKKWVKEKPIEDLEFIMEKGNNLCPKVFQRKFSLEFRITFLRCRTENHFLGRKVGTSITPAFGRTLDLPKISERKLEQRTDWKTS